VNKVEKFAFLLFWIIFAIFGIPLFIPLVNVGSFGWIMVLVLIIVAIAVPIAALKSKGD
jgi:hypothetical protein